MSQKTAKKVRRLCPLFYFNRIYTNGGIFRQWLTGWAIIWGQHRRVSDCVGHTNSWLVSGVHWIDSGSLFPLLHLPLETFQVHLLTSFFAIAFLNYNFHYIVLHTTFLSHKSLEITKYTFLFIHPTQCSEKHALYELFYEEWTNKIRELTEIHVPYRPEAVTVRELDDGNQFCHWEKLLLHVQLLVIDDSEQRRFFRSIVSPFRDE